MQRCQHAIFALSLTLLSSLCGCGRAQETVILQREWTGNAEYAGDVWASDIAKQRGLDLEVREGSEVIDPIRLVRSERAHFGVASADRVLRENENGAGLVVLATATHRSPVVFLTKPEIDVRHLASLADKTVGLQAGTNTELVFRALIAHNGLRLDDLRVVESGWGTGTFETGTIDVLGAFAYDEPISLRRKGRAFNTIDPKLFNVDYIGTVYFTRRSLANERPELVQGFMDVLVDGWRHALANPEAAIDKLAERYETVASNKDKERESLAVGRDYFVGDDGYLLFASPARWSAMAESLVQLGELRRFEFAENVDYEFLMAASP